MSVETCVDVTLRFKCGASGHVHLNFVQRHAEHRLVIIGTDGTVAWNHDDHNARLYSAASKAWEIVTPPDGFERNTMFLDEMRHFLACVSDKEQPVCTLTDGRAALHTAVRAKQAIATVRAASAASTAPVSVTT